MPAANFLDTDSQIVAMVKDCYGINVSSIRSVLQGLHRVYSLADEYDNCFFLKIYNSAVSPCAVRREARILLILRQRGLKVPEVIQPLRRKRQGPSPFNSAVMLTREIKGDKASASLFSMSLLGQALGRLHQQTLKATAFNSPTAWTWLSECAELTTVIRQHAAQLGADATNLISALQYAANALADTHVLTCLTHGDTGYGNALIRDDELYLLDFEHVGYRDLRYDIGIAFFHVQRLPTPEKQNIIDAFKVAYGEQHFYADTAYIHIHLAIFMRAVWCICFLLKFTSTPAGLLKRSVDHALCLLADPGTPGVLLINNDVITHQPGANWRWSVGSSIN